MIDEAGRQTRQQEGVFERHAVDRSRAAAGVSGGSDGGIQAAQHVFRGAGELVGGDELVFCNLEGVNPQVFPLSFACISCSGPVVLFKALALAHTSESSVNKYAPSHTHTHIHTNTHTCIPYMNVSNVHTQ